MNVIFLDRFRPKLRTWWADESNRNLTLVLVLLLAVLLVWGFLFSQGVLGTMRGGAGQMCNRDATCDFDNLECVPKWSNYYCEEKR